MIELLVKVLAAYLLGGVMGGDVMRRLRGGPDLRQAGSGNVGATNALRTRGAGFAVGVLAIDIGKGVAAALAIPALPWPWPQSSGVPVLLLGYLCGLAAALGHCYPAFQKFHGGKGVATLSGVFAALLPWAMPWMVAVFALTVMLSGYVSLASLLGALTAWAWAALHGGAASPAGRFALAMLALLVFKHRDNIRRLLAGSEHRFDKAMVLRRWLAR
ncbi:MAG: glycerol-3-phosphate 1-O-acyltransferase PlsY [Nevskia sp.]|nr:glycerol-3-phosphate 1-O-acyltransferase PlsY [Nevskia sp.]